MPINRRILLLEPPYYRLHKHSYSVQKYPLALGYLAGALLRGPKPEMHGESH